MSEPMWLTLAAMAIMLVVLIPANYLISLFWERDPSNLTVEHPAREQARGDASLIVAVTNMPSPDALKALGGLVAYHYIEEVFLIASSTHGANNSGPIQQTPKTTARRFEPVAAA